MKRKDFYAEYYRITNAAFADKSVWNNESRERAWRKKQIYMSKRERRICVFLQYLILPLCLLPVFTGREALWLIPCVTLCSFLLALESNFSIIKIEMLYSIYRKDDLYSSLLYDMFRNRLGDFREKLRLATKTVSGGYTLRRGGGFFGKYCAWCRDPKQNITFVLKRNKVSVNVNGAVTDITDKTLTREQLISRMAEIINAVKCDGGKQNATS